MGLLRYVRYIPRPVVRLVQYGLIGSLILCALMAYRDRIKNEQGLAEDEIRPARWMKVVKKDVSAHGELVDEFTHKPHSSLQSFPLLYNSSEMSRENVGPEPGSPEYQSMPRDRDWTDYDQIFTDKKRKGYGEHGKPVHLPADKATKDLEEQIYKVNGYDGLVSDYISLNRSVLDTRPNQCKKKKHLRKLPSVSVIFPFHDEHNSTLLRSAFSVLNRSPPGIVREIILVDDASTKDFLQKPLADFCAKNLPMVKIIRCPKRQGLIRARQIGAQHATMDILIFLDSHSEANYNWIPPLIQPIALNYKTVTCPFVDGIHCDTYAYTGAGGGRGSFDWELSYKQFPLEDEHTRDPSEPYKNPVMIGGYFAISSKWFWELGGYDEGLDIWGGEQYELSFKTWQCHGEMWDIPCSRVGHIYRCKYIPFPNPNVGDFVNRNYKRVAEVWMDEYKEYVYKRRPIMRNTDARDMTKQKAIREKLKCKSFDWFMKNVAYDQDKHYPAIEPPDGANGEIRNLGTDKCIDTFNHEKETTFNTKTCQSDDPSIQAEQQFRFSFWKDIRQNDRQLCFDASDHKPLAKILLYPCHGMQGNQAWKWNNDKKQIYHMLAPHLCMDTNETDGAVFLNTCNDESKSQKWHFKGLNQTVVDSWKYDR